jgi:hypothetical protein
VEVFEFVKRRGLIDGIGYFAMKMGGRDMHKLRKDLI